MILDTCFLVDLLRGNNDAAWQKAVELDKKLETKAVSPITIMELWRGIKKSSHIDKETILIEHLLSSMIVLNFGEKEAKKAGELEAELIEQGEIFDLEDIMIAATAIVRNQELLTKNTKHFSRIKELKIKSY